MTLTTSVPSPTRTMFIPEMGEVYFNAQKFFLNISEELQCTYSFDPEGRFMTGFFDGVNYRRSLKSDILMKYFADSPFKTCRFLAPEENQQLIDNVLQRVRYIRSTIKAEDDLALWLDAILAWNFARLQDERATFDAIYRPISILPPDQYLSVVLQAAEGCSWNKCTFCSFYRDRTFRIKSPQAFRQHIQQVKQFLGRAVGLRKSIFLADANALIISQSRLIELLKIVHEEFPINESRPGEDYRLKGIYSFLDIVGAERKTLADYQELREYGVKRIYIGLETGDNDLFKLLNKPGSPSDCIEAVQTIKAAGINIGVILLAGAGGARFATQHVQQSLNALAAMPLGVGDIVYVSPLVIAPDDDYVTQMNDLGIPALDQPAVLQQVETIKANVKRVQAGGPKVALYHIEEFIY